MRPFDIALAIGLANILDPTTPATAQAVQAAQAETLDQKIASYVAPLVQTNNFAGAILVAERGEVRVARGFGYADIEQRVLSTPWTRYQIASLSKPFTSAAIMLLVQRGAVNLNAPLSKLLPDYPNGEKLTVHHLLSHGSGIPNINDFPEYEQLQMKPHSTAELVSYFNDKPLGFTPGTKYEYSNSNYNLLAHIIERVSGQSYGEFINREILGPLVLRETGHRSNMTDIIAGLADGYAPRGPLGLQRSQYLDWTVKTGNGSLYSSASDLVRFVRAVHGESLLSPGSRSALFTKHSPNAGYGWFMTKANGKEIHHLNGRSPGWAAQLDHYVNEDVTVVVLSNTYNSVTTPVARGVGAIYFGLPPEPMPALRPEPLTSAEAERLVGTYKFGPEYYVPNSTVTITTEDGHIQAEYPSGYPASPYVSISSTKFIVRPFWMPAEFVIGADGKATGLVLDGFRGTRVN
ncbi:MAG: serine hydrolase [Pseudomonadota bacterium]|nr:serine hydrolase [Sphingomonas sp.]MDQ3479248.1 serine hydrolase [Pseudomonadota bacterium]